MMSQEELSKWLSLKPTYQNFPPVEVSQQLHVDSEVYPHGVAFEGLSACGKTLALQTAKAELEKNGVIVLYSHSPNLSLPGGDEIAKILANGDEKIRCSPETIRLFMINQSLIDKDLRQQANAILTANPKALIVILWDRSPICGVVYSCLQNPANAYYYAHYYGFLPKPKFYITLYANEKDREMRWQARTKQRPWFTDQRYTGYFSINCCAKLQKRGISYDRYFRA